MATSNNNTINKTLHITADIYNIFMKNQNRVVINRCNNKQLYDNTFYRNFYKKKSFEDLMKKNQIFCSNFCGSDINNCSCYVRYNKSHINIF